VQLRTAESRQSLSHTIHNRDLAKYKPKEFNYTANFGGNPLYVGQKNYSDYVKLEIGPQKLIFLVRNHFDEASAHSKLICLISMLGSYTDKFAVHIMPILQDMYTQHKCLVHTHHIVELLQYL